MAVSSYPHPEGRIGQIKNFVQAGIFAVGSRLRCVRKVKPRLEVTHHLTTSQVEHFCVSALAEDELAAAAIHVANCQPCQTELTEELGRQNSSRPLNFTLEPEFWFRNDHVDFDELVGLADNTLDDDLREVIDIHFKTCEKCREDVRSFLAFRVANAREMYVSYGREAPQYVLLTVPWWQRLHMPPVYAVTAVLLVALTLLVAMIAINIRSGSLEAGRKEQTNINVENPATSPTVVATSPVVDDSKTVATLKDAHGEVSIDTKGHVTGLDELSDSARQLIAQAALSERLVPPSVLRDLSANQSGLRGDDATERELKLLYPVRRVVIEDRPVFKWESLPSVTHYRVYVLDAKGNQVCKSEELPQIQTQWKTSTPLRRGQIFSWFVTALIDGKEIVSPSASASEMKFAVLSIKDLQESSQLKEQKSHLALGVFYARTGLTSEAESEFQSLIQLNPQSDLARKLLQSVRSMHK